MHCRMCNKVMLQAHVQPFGLDSDCGGDCWECIRKVEQELDGPTLSIAVHLTNDEILQLITALSTHVEEYTGITPQPIIESYEQLKDKLQGIVFSTKINHNP